MNQDKLRKEWDRLSTPIFRVIDPETGENMAGALIRKRVDDSTYLYVDEMDGFKILNIIERNYLTLEAIR